MSLQGLSCAYHRERPCSLECTLCHLPLCRSCTVREDSQDRVVHRCPKCKVVLEDVDLAPPPELPAARVVPRPTAQAFADQIGDILRFPFRTSILYALAGLLIFTTLLNWAVVNNMFGGLALLGTLIVRGVEIALYFHFVSQTAHGEEDIEPPDVSELWEQIVGPFVRYLVALLPLIIGVVWLAMRLGTGLVELERSGHIGELARGATGPLLLILLGLALLPLLTIIAAVSRSVTAMLNPLLWVHVLRITGTSYALGALLFYGVFFAEFVVLVPTLVAAVAMPFSLVGIAMTSAVSYVMMAYRARILGAICRPHMAELEGRSGH